MGPGSLQGSEVATSQQIQGGLASGYLSGDRPSEERTGLPQGGIPVTWSSALGMRGRG